MLKEFKEFAMRGNVVDMAVGIIIGGAFGTIVKNLVDDVLMPPIGLLLGGVDFSNFFVFLLIRAINALRRQVEVAPAPATTKECQYCASSIPIKATRCPQCTSQ